MSNIVSIGTLAQQLGEPKRTLFRQLFHLQAKTEVRFMFRPGQHWRVNVSLLRELHPVMFPVVSLAERMGKAEAIIEEHSLALATLVPTVGKLRARAGV